jgi:hypothetical protein
MRTPTLVGSLGPAENVYRTVRNADTTVILRGTPCCFVMNGTRDGFDVVQSSTSGVNKSTAYFAGIAAEDIAVGELGPALIKGVANFVRCSGSVAVETTLSVNPAANNFVGGATVATVIAVTSVGPAVLPALVNAIATATVNGVANVSTRVMVNA